jgi:uncharacterized membrane protein
MDVYPLVLRVVHIGGAVFWAGASWMLAGFVSPAAKQIQPGGPAVMRVIIQKRKLSEVFSLAAVLTVASGLLLYWRLSSGLNPNWLTSGPGLSLSLGAIAGLATLVIGITVNRPVSLKLAELGSQAASSGVQPDPETLAQLGQLQSRLEQAGIWASVLLAISVVAMASAETLYF